MKKQYWAIICLVCMFLGLERLYTYQNGRFKVAKILSPNLPISKPVPTEVDQLLDQDFYFIGKGCTCFVFLGKDRKTILKLFNHSRLHFKSLLSKCIFPGVADHLRIHNLYAKKRKAARKQQDFVFASCQLAEDKIPSETGLIYLCLQPNLYFLRKITLIDKWGFRHVIALNKIEFALQTKAEPFLQYLDQIKGSDDKMRFAIDAFLNNIFQRCLHGIGDWDPNVAINFGWADQKVIEYDLGGFYLKPSLAYKEQWTREVFFASFGLQEWLKRYSPEHFTYFLSKLHSVEREKDQ